MIQGARREQEVAMLNKSDVLEETIPFKVHVCIDGGMSSTGYSTAVNLLGG